ncbi:MAG TPA: 3-deoxy-D-manno-octulosonic acid transferase [Acidobacteriaceae bacterium]|jgi:3-deoxy-D-manno-octulosonic-acid transferase
MALYSAILMLGLLLSSPWWVLRMLTTSRYREGMRERLGLVPARLRQAGAGRRVIWIHAVSVGEVLAASRLVAELETALGEPWRIVISTTTRTGNTLARERFGEARTFYFPLDFAWAVRAWLRALRPAALVLMESELWPRVLHECGRERIPVAVVNARVSDRSFRRGVRVKRLWGKMLRKVSLWLAQSDEDARRLIAMGARPETVRPTGNLKYDVRANRQSRVAEWIRQTADGRPVVVAGSTVEDRGEAEEQILLAAWQSRPRTERNALLVLAPRHPERFATVETLLRAFSYIKASDWTNSTEDALPHAGMQPEIVLLDTIGDLAAVYGVADVAFVGGSLVPRGGHNPLEPAQFGVPVLMGPSFENFRDIVRRMKNAGAIRLAANRDEVEEALTTMLTNRDEALAMGERGRDVFEQQQGATDRTVDALKSLIHGQGAAA